MDQPPPPPPHGRPPPPRSSNLPPGNYDIFIIPPHSSGSGFLYLPSLKPNVNSFAAGFASALVLVALFQSMAPAFRAWWSSFQGMGDMGIAMLVIAVGVGAWALGRTQQDNGSAPRGGRFGGFGGFQGGGYGPNAESHSAGPSPHNGPSPNAGPPPNAGPEPDYGPPPPPPPHSSPPPRRPGPPPHANNAEPPKAESPRPEPSRPEPPRQEPPRPEPPRPEARPEPRPKPKPESEPEPAKPEPPKPEPSSPEQPKSSWKQRPQPETSKGTWERAREETRRKEEERKAKEAERKVKEAEQRKKEEVARRLKELREKEARERVRREREAKQRQEQEAQERLRREQELREKLEQEAREKIRRELEARDKQEREAREREQREREQRERELREKEQREREQREKEQREKAQREKEIRDNRLREARERELRERLEREKILREKLEKEAKEREAARLREAQAAKEAQEAKEREETTRRSTYAFSSVGERTNPWPNGRPPTQPASPVKPSPPPSTAPSAAPSSAKRPPPPTAKTTDGHDDDAYSYRPYDQPRGHARRRSGETIFTESSYAPSHSTTRTSPPPSMRAPYTTKDPDKIVIKAVYGFLNQFSKTPASQLISGIGSVTDGLILRITTEGLFIDDDVRAVPQREWDIKAWTLKLMEVWCPSHCFVEPSASPKPPPKTGNRFRTAPRGQPKTLTGNDADAYLIELLQSCKNECRLGPHGGRDDASSYANGSTQTGEWKHRGLHVLRANIRDQEGKRFMFVLGEEEGWKVAAGLQRLRRGTQVRQLGVQSMAPLEARNTLEMLGW